MPDAITKLVEASQQGDRASYEQLVNLYLAQVQWAAYIIIRDRHLAEDITQEAFIKAWQNLPRLKDGTKFPAWLMEIARNTARDYFKKRKISMIPLDEVAESVSTAVSVKPSLSESDEHILEKVRQLPDDYQNLLMLRYFEDLSYKEIAGRLSMNVSAVGEKLCRIRQMLRSIERSTVNHK